MNSSSKVGFRDLYKSREKLINFPEKLYKSPKHESNHQIDFVVMNSMTGNLRKINSKRKRGLIFL